MGEWGQEGRECVVGCYAGGVQAGDGGEEVLVGHGVVEVGCGEGGHFLNWIEKCLGRVGLG